jgi:molecular chaperone GrpE
MGENGNGKTSAASTPAEPPSVGPDVKVVDRRWWAREAGEAGAAGEEAELRKPTYLEELERQLAEKDAALQRYLSQHKQAVGEFEDVKTRIRREMARDVERSRRAVLAEFLDVLDNLERATAAARASSNVDALLNGLDLVERQFRAKLEGFGINRIESLGEMFDPLRHEAVSAVPVADESQDGRVAGVVRPGYAIGDEVLRPAQVAVGRHEAARP